MTEHTSQTSKCIKVTLIIINSHTTTEIQIGALRLVRQALRRIWNCRKSDFLTSSCRNSKPKSMRTRNHVGYRHNVTQFSLYHVWGSTKWEMVVLLTNLISKNRWVKKEMFSWPSYKPRVVDLPHPEQMYFHHCLILLYFLLPDNI